MVGAILISSPFERLTSIEATNATIEYYGCVMMIAAAATAIGMKLERKYLRILLLAFLSTFLCLFSAATATMFFGLKDPFFQILIKVLQGFSLLNAIAAVFFYCVYALQNLTEDKEKSTTIIKTVFVCLSAITAGLIIASFFTGWIYKLNEEGRAVRGDFHFLYSAHCLLCFLFILGYTLYKFFTEKKKEVLVLGLYLLLPIFGIILSFFIKEFAIFEICLLLLMFLALFRSQMQYVARIISQQKRLSEQEIELARMRERVLLSQVKPHFIYNALTAMKMIEGNPPETMKAIDDFASYLRSHLSGEERPLIPLPEELNHVKTYLNIENLRFGDELKAEFDIQDEDFLVPTLSIQMLVENAVKHGVSVKRGGGTISVSSFLEKREEKAFHVIIVEDDGVGFDTKADFAEGHVGLKNVEARLSLQLHGSLRVESEIGKGTKVTVSIPQE